MSITGHHYPAMSASLAARFSDGRAAIRQALIEDPAASRDTLRAVTGYTPRNSIVAQIRHELETARVSHVYRPQWHGTRRGVHLAHDLDQCWCTQPEPQPERRELSSPDNLKPWPARATTSAGAAELHTYLKDSPLDCGHAFTTGETQPYLGDIVYCRRCMQFRVVTEGRTMPRNMDDTPERTLSKANTMQMQARDDRMATYRDLIAAEPELTSQQVAEAMGISLHTAHRYRQRAIQQGAFSTGGPGLIDR